MRTPGRYSIVRFVPDPVRDEPINIGAILQSDGIIDSLFLAELDRVERLDPHADTKLIRDWVSGFKKELSKPLSSSIGGSCFDKDYLHRLSQRYSRQIQITQPRGTLYVDFGAEMQDLFETFVSIEEQTSERPEDSRAVRRRFIDVIKGLHIENRVEIDQHEIRTSRITFVADFYVNGGANRVIQALSFNSRKDHAKLARAKEWAYNFRNAVDEQVLERSDHITVLIQPPAEPTEGFNQALTIIEDTCQTRLATPDNLLEMGNRIKHWIERR